MPRQSGFTLIEIMVVVIIIGVLSAIVAPAVIGRIEDTRVEVVKVDLRTIASALKMYRVDNFGYPSNESGLLALIEDPRDTSAPNWNREGYLDDDEVPRDPWGTEYQYLNPGPDGSDFYVYSLGADRAPGGEDADADISTSEL